MKSVSIIPRLQLAAALALTGLTPTTGSAVDFFFNVPNGDWNAAGSWTPAGPPAGAGGNFAFVNNGGTANITANIPTIQDPFIGRGAGNSGTVNHSAGNHNNVGWTFIGDQSGTGAYNLTGPGNTLGSGNLSTGRIYIGGSRTGQNGGNGTMRVNTTGTVTATSDLSVGTRGATGSLTVTAGTINANNWMIIGETEGGVGGSTGTVVQNGGNVNVSATELNGRLWIGSQEGGAGPASNGSYTINGGTLNARTTIIGKNYTGTLNQNGGIVTLNQGTDSGASDHRLGEALGATGNYNLTNGTLNLNANFQIGASGTGIFTQTGGIVNANNFPVVGRFTGGTGTLTVSNGAFNQLDPAAGLIIGESGAGTLALSGGGAVNVQNNLSLATQPGSSGIVNQTGGTVAVVNILDIQGAGTGSYNLDGGTVSVNGSLDATAGTFTFTGGVLTRSNAGTISYLGNLTVGQNDATLKLNNDKTFAVSGILNVATGVTFDVTGQSLPAVGLFVQSGSIPLGIDGSIVGLFDPVSTFVTGLGNPAGATFISELSGESMSFDPNTQSVYWVQENAGNVTLNYSIVPEPSALLSLAGGIAMLAGFQRRRRG